VKIWSLLLLSALMATAGLPAAGAAEVLGVLEIRGIENLAEAVFDLSQATGQPVPKEMVVMGLNDALGSPAGIGLEPNGTLRALWLSGDSPQGSLVLQLPVQEDGAEYLSALGQAGWTSDSETGDGILHFKAPDGQFSPWSDVYLLKGEQTLLAAQTAEQARQAAAALPGLVPILPAEGVVVFQLRIAALIEAFEPLIQGQMNQMFEMTSGQNEEAAAVGRLYVRGYLSAGKQVEEFVLGLGVADGSLNLHTRLAPVAGRTLAKWLASLKAPSAAASVVNLPDALFVETAHLGNVQLIAEPYFRYVEELLKIIPQDIPADSFATYMNGIRTYWSQLAGDFGIALLPPTRQNPLRLAEYVALKEPSSLRSLTVQMVSVANEMMTAMMSMDPNQPVKIGLAQAEPREYRDVPIDRVVYRLEPGELLAGLWPAGRTLELTAELAWLDHGVLVGVGGADITEMLVDRALDGTTAPVSSLPAWKAFFPTPEPRLIDLSHVALFDSLRQYIALLDSVTGDESANEIPPGPGSISSLSYLAMDGLMTRVRFSLADIAALANKAQEAQQRGQEAAREAQQEALERMMQEEGFSFGDMQETESGTWTFDDEEDEDEDDEGDWDSEESDADVETVE
jgi:hypothetical protein